MKPRWLIGSFLPFLFLCAIVRADEPAKAPPITPATAPSASPEMLAPEQPAGATSKPAELVIIQKGDWPIILSAPHGGRLAIPGAPKRTGDTFLTKKGVKNNYTNAFDGNVDKVAFALADEIQKRTGHRPFLVVANFSRSYCDANRTPEEAYESAPAGAVYDQYHGAIRAFRAEIIAKWQRGLLIDIHGQGRDAEAIIRGTADWTSDKHMVEEFGKESIVGPGGLLGPLAKAGNKFIPPIDKLEEPEYAALNGGFITREYGSYQGGNFDAIQFELGGKYRKVENIPAFASSLSDGLVPFAEKYLLIGATKAPATEPAGEKKPATEPAGEKKPATEPTGGE